MENNKLRILFLITDLGKGGAERFLIDLCSELQNYNNIEFIIGTIFDNNQYKDLTSNFTIKNLNYKTFSLLGKNDYPEYKELINTFKPHIIHTHRFLGEFISSFYINSNITYICHGHDNMEQFNNFSLKTLFNKKLFLQYLEKLWLIKKKYNHVKTYFIANSNHTLNFYKKNIKNSNVDIRLLYYGFNYNRFFSPLPKKIDVNKKLTLINVGSFQHKKNQIFLLSVAEELINMNIDFSLNLIGHGEYFNFIAEQIKSRNLSNHVFLKGIIHNVEEYYHAGDIYIHSAYYEPFGLVFLEAMAAGLPVITLDGKGNRDIIENGKNGFIFTQQNAKEFAKAVKFLVDNKSEYEKISKYCKEYAKNFDLKKKTKELVDFYYSVIQKG